MLIVHDKIIHYNVFLFSLCQSRWRWCTWLPPTIKQSILLLDIFTVMVTASRSVTIHLNFECNSFGNRNQKSKWCQNVRIFFNNYKKKKSALNMIIFLLWSLKVMITVWWVWHHDSPLDTLDTSSWTRTHKNLTVTGQIRISISKCASLCSTTV